MSETLDLEARQKRLLRDLLEREEVRLSVTIPEDATPESLMQNLELCCCSIVRLEGAIGAIKPLLGRILLLIQMRGLYQPEFRTFDEFLRVKVRRDWKMS